MFSFNLHTTEYSVSGLRGFSLSEALRLWKAKFETLKHFKRDVIKNPALKELETFVEETWESILPITVTEAFQEQNMEIRRVMFDCIGVAKLFRALEPELLDKQTIHKTRTRWDKDKRPYEYSYDDTYELYKIDGKKLFIPEMYWAYRNPVYSIRCWCTTTGREYWIYVPQEAAMNESASSKEPHVIHDAIKVIAWTIRIDITKPKRIYRQGDIIIAEESILSEPTEPYHLSKEQYLQLMYSET